MHKIQLHLTQLVMEFLGVSCFSSPNYGTPSPELSSEAIKEALIKHEIYKDLGYVKYPKHLLQVNFAEHHLQLGTRVPPNLAIVPPDGINYTYYEKRGYYALLTVGLDIPTRENPSERAYWHWALGNIPEHRILSAEGLIHWEWVDAPYKKGLHRVVFLLFKQKGEKPMVYDERAILRSGIQLPRTNFSARKFSSRYDLGDPVAVNFFITDIEEDHLL